VATKLSDQGELLIEQDQEKLWGVSFGAATGQSAPSPASKCQLVVRDGDVYLARSKGSKLDVDKSPFRGAARERVSFDLPKDGKPSVGQSWSSVTHSESLECTMNHKLVGFAMVDGVLAAKIVSEGEMKLPSVAANELLGALKGASEKSKVSSDFKLPPDFKFPAMLRKTVTYVELDPESIDQALSGRATRSRGGSKPRRWRRE
jgi:hypothetical protein